MSEKNTSWFHCGRCGSLFESPLGESDDRHCPSCGCKPSLGIETPASEPGALPQGEPATSTEKIALPLIREKQAVRKRRRTYFMGKLVGGWMLVLIVIVLGAKYLYQEDPTTSKPFVAQSAGKEVVAAADIMLLDNAIPLCNQVFSSYLSSGTDEERSQYVLHPIDTAARMSRYYNLNPLVNLDPRTLSLAANAVLHIPEGRAIETQWKSSDDRLIDAVFIEEKGEWRLDWEHYLRFSDYPWALFLAGSGDDHGEFRLLARERLADERKNADTLSIRLYAPRFGYSKDTGFASPEFLVPRKSKSGRSLDAAFKLEKTGKRVFGVTLPDIDPESFIRVRVKIRRMGETSDHRYELEDVIACHWYSTEAPGLEIPEPPPEN